MKLLDKNQNSHLYPVYTSDTRVISEYSVVTGVTQLKCVCKQLNYPGVFPEMTHLDHSQDVLSEYYTPSPLNLKCKHRLTSEHSKCHGNWRKLYFRKVFEKNASDDDDDLAFI